MAENNQKTTDYLLIFALIAIGIAARLMSHIPNVTPVAALALFGAANLRRPWGLVIPAIAMLVSDYFIGFYGVTMIYVYAGFVLTGLVGYWLSKNQSAKTVIASSLLSSVIFYIVTNFGAWIDPRMGYAPTIQGLWQSYINALPFFRNSLLGDLGYTTAFFGLYALVKNPQSITALLSHKKLA